MTVQEKFKEAVIFLTQNKLKEAKKILSKILSDYPKHSDSINMLGVAAYLSKEYKEAKELFEKSIILNPNNSAYHNNFGNLLKDAGDFDGALKSYFIALELNKNDFGACNNIGIIFRELKKYNEAVLYYNKAITINPNFADAYYNLGILFEQTLDINIALENYTKAINLNPYHAKANFNKSLCLLKIGNFSEGFNLYDWRWKAEDREGYQRPLFDINKRLWDGKSFNGTLLVWSEQGLGDHLLYSRFIFFLKNLKIKILFLADKRTINFFKNLFKYNNINNIEVTDIERGLKKSFNYHIPSGSLGKYYFNKISKINDYKVGSDIFIDKYKDPGFIKKINSLQGLKVGISWKTLNKNELYRSIDLKNFLDIFQLNNFHFINLQFGNVISEIEEMKVKGVNIHFSSKLDYSKDVDDVFSLIRSLDVVLSVQNSVAHMALTIKKKTIVLLPSLNRWYYGLNPHKTIWYSEADLYRQKNKDSWQNVIYEVKKNLMSINGKI